MYIGLGIVINSVLSARVGFGPSYMNQDFEGSSLPSDWIFEDPLSAGGSYVVTDSRVEVTIPSGVTLDSVNSTSSDDNTVGIYKTSDYTDIDIAFQIDTDVSQWGGLQVNFLLSGNAEVDTCRFAVYQGNPNLYGYQRASGAGSSSGNAALTAYYNWWHGIPSWYRVTYDSGTGLWSFYASSDGVTWILCQQGTRSFVADKIKIGVGQTGGTPGGTVRVNRVIDFLGAGSTDAREAISPGTTTTRILLEGTDGVLPASFTDDSASGGSLTWTGTALRATTDLDTIGSRARIQYTGTTYDNCGILTKFQFIQSSASSYAVFGIGSDSGGIDQYSRGPGYGFELTGAIYRRFIRVDDIGDVLDSFDDQYTFLVDDTDTTLGGTPGPLTWSRVERYNGRVRGRYWTDGDAEPTTWFFDGEEEVIDNPFGPILTYSHNDGTSGGDEFLDIFSYEFYTY